MIGDHYSKEKDGYPVYYRVTDTYGKRMLIASGIYTTSRFTSTEFPIHDMSAEDFVRFFKSSDEILSATILLFVINFTQNNHKGLLLPRNYRNLR